MLIVPWLTFSPTVVVRQAIYLSTGSSVSNVVVVDVRVLSVVVIYRKFSILSDT